MSHLPHDVYKILLDQGWEDPGYGCDLQHWLGTAYHMRVILITHRTTPVKAFFKLDMQKGIHLGKLSEMMGILERTTALLKSAGVLVFEDVRTPRQQRAAIYEHSTREQERRKALK